MASIVIFGHEAACPSPLFKLLERQKQEIELLKAMIDLLKQKDL